MLVVSACWIQYKLELVVSFILFATKVTTQQHIVFLGCSSLMWFFRVVFFFSIKKCFNSVCCVLCVHVMMYAKVPRKENDGYTTMEKKWNGVTTENGVGQEIFFV